MDNYMDHLLVLDESENQLDGKRWSNTKAFAGRAYEKAKPPISGNKTSQWSDTKAFAGRTYDRAKRSSSAAFAFTKEALGKAKLYLKNKMS